jgi:hypothetical protein
VLCEENVDIADWQTVNVEYAIESKRLVLKAEQIGNRQLAIGNIHQLAIANWQSEIFISRQSPIRN